jgi:Ca2+-binding EF-hand superfamily protein
VCYKCYVILHLFCGGASSHLKRLLNSGKLVDAINHSEREKDIRKAFDSYDRNKNGTVEGSEMVRTVTRGVFFVV